MHYLCLSFCTLVCVLFPLVATAAESVSTDSLMKKLDSVISHRDRYLAEKQQRLADITGSLATADSEYEKFDVLDSLFNEYHSFSADSAYSVSLKQEEIAAALKDPALAVRAQMHHADILAAIGLYYEALTHINAIDISQVPAGFEPYYYHIKRTIYGNLAQYSEFTPESKYYEALTDAYRDTLLSYHPESSLTHTLIKADQYNFRNMPGKALEVLNAYLDTARITEHQKAICAYNLSESYGLLGDTENQKRQLVISSIADMQSAVREYVSLRQLALLLYKEGDLDRAYEFLTIAVADAAECNARQRMVELTDSYPVINGIYVDKVRAQKRTLERTILIITILSVILVVMLFMMRKQMRRTAQARKKVEESNIMLGELNSKLSKSNSLLNDANFRLSASNASLQEANEAIAEISELKEVYIGRYMDQCLGYIEKLETYRRNVQKLIAAGKHEELKKFVKTAGSADAEFKEFYERFDATFLNLFPSFVEDFNKLLQPQEAILPKKPGTLTSELRVFALIRLGISDSDKIAKFLRYSLTTIYNYRTKVRNKARGDRSALEAEVMKIGRNA